VSPANDYRQRLTLREAQVTRLSKGLDNFGNARLAVAAVILVAAGFSFFRATFSPAWLLLGVVAFAALVVAHQVARQSHSRAGRAADFYRRGLARIEDQWPGTGRSGTQFDDPHHVYASDLDLFGRGSLFELLCTVRTRMGEECLAAWLKSPASLQVIRDRQAGIADLKNRVDLREELALIGEHADVGIHPAALLEWAEAPNTLVARPLFWLGVLLPVVAILSAAYWALTGIETPFFLTLVVEAAVLSVVRRAVDRVLNGSETAFADLRMFSDLLLRVEREKVSAPALQALLDRLASHGRKASQTIGSLSTIVNFAGSRRNQLMALLLIPLMYTLNVALAAQRWRREHGHAVRSWVEVVGELEALLSLAAYSHEHPDDPFPEFVAGPASFAATGLGHPLIPQARCVRNDVSITVPTRILLVSGSNMSGKSTLLRTVGINTVLAMTGAPVRARVLQVTELRIGASIRINDSLHEGSSRFYAEITRLRQLFDLTQGPQQLLFLLDELLQGTNSKDRRSGAEGIVRALVARGAIGLISTHDLALTDISGLQPAALRNVHFQDELQNGRMIFDFKLRDGVVTKSNAMELMRSIGLDV
jgi:ABC-type multidrug transport system fused ATPase/permease subunit